MLRFAMSESSDELFANAAAQAAQTCLRVSALTLDNSTQSSRHPHANEFRAALSAQIGYPETKIIVPEDQRTHTASLAAAFDRASEQIRSGGRGLLVAAAAGITAGAALYRMPD